MVEAIRYNIEPRKIQFDGFPVARLLPRIGLNSVGPGLQLWHGLPEEHIEVRAIKLNGFDTGYLK